MDQMLTFQRLVLNRSWSYRVKKDECSWTPNWTLNSETENPSVFFQSGCTRVELDQTSAQDFEGIAGKTSVPDLFKAPGVQPRQIRQKSAMCYRPSINGLKSSVQTSVVDMDFQGSVRIHYRLILSLLSRSGLFSEAMHSHLQHPFLHLFSQCSHLSIAQKCLQLLSDF